jgi:Tyrosyl-DNA phosphodiesterase
MGKGIRLVFPKLKNFGAFGVGCMHSKLQLLFHKDHLRVVVPTVFSDFGELT